MALYHFSVKNDKRPKDKERISGAEKIEYINREGKYANLDKKEMRDVENCITTANRTDAFFGKRIHLYSSPFGKILNMEKGLLLSNRPSHDTIAIACMIAKESMGDPLIVRGSNRFKQKCVEAAVAADLPISFENKSMQRKLEKMRKEKENERREFEQHGGSYVERSSRLPQSNPNGNRSTISRITSPRAIPRLRELPKCRMETHRQRSAPMLLSPDERSKLGDWRAKSDALLRWNLSGQRREHARIAAQKILQNVERYGDKISSERHIEYINREKAFAKKGGCIYTQSRLPKWAKDSPNTFFHAADRYSPKNAARYKELQFSLQNELSLEQNIELINTFIGRVLPNHYYNFAIHDKIGAMADGTHNLHVHIVFSTRKIDEIEEKEERNPENYFKYPLRENAQDQSEEAERTHGAPMERNWSRKEYVEYLRVVYEEVTNETLEKYGYSARVDHRSLEAQKKEAEMNGDKLLASILDRLPEKYLGVNPVYEENPEVEALLKWRKSKNKLHNILFHAERLNHDIQSKKVDKEKANIEKRLEALLNSSEFIESDNSNESAIGKLRSDFVEAAKKYQRLQKMLVTAEAAEESAKLEYMKEEERETYQEWKQVSEELDHWKTFQENLHQPEQATPEEIATYQELLPTLADKLEALQKKKTALKEKMDEIEEKLHNPDIQKQINLITHRKLEANKFIRRDLWKAQKNLEAMMQALEQGIFATTTAENTQDTYTLHQLHKISRKRYFGLKKEKERLQEKLATAKKSVISMDRASNMAANIYTKGALKKYREERRAYKKQETYLANDVKKFKEKAAAFPSNLPTDLVEERLALQARVQQLRSQKEALDRTEKDLAQRIDSTTGQEKIKEIALGILQKNQPAQKRLETIEKALAEVEKRYKQAGENLATMTNLVQEAAEKQRPERIYKVVNQENPTLGGTSSTQKHTKPTNDAKPVTSRMQDNPSTIIKALSGDARYAPLVATARKDDNSLKNWKLMSEMERDEEANKNLYQGLV